MQEMPEVLKITILKSLKMLSSMPGCAFKILLPNGEIISHDPTGALDEKCNGGNGKRRNYRNPGIPRGGLANYVRAFIEGMKPGDVRSIPFVDPDTKTTFNGLSIASSASSYMAKVYGSGNYTTFRNDAKQCVEIYLGITDHE